MAGEELIPYDYKKSLKKAAKIIVPILVALGIADAASDVNTFVSLLTPAVVSISAVVVFALDWFKKRKGIPVKK